MKYQIVLAGLIPHQVRTLCLSSLTCPRYSPGAASLPIYLTNKTQCHTVNLYVLSSSKQTRNKIPSIFSFVVFFPNITSPVPTSYQLFDLNCRQSLPPFSSVSGRREDCETRTQCPPVCGGYPGIYWVIAHWWPPTN